MLVDAQDYFDNGEGIVTMCGSTRFYFECMEVQRILTFKNWMVFGCGSYGHSFHKYSKKLYDHDYAIVKILHYRKISQSDSIVIVSDKSCYMGDSTKAELYFAKYYLEIPIFYFDGSNLLGKIEIENYPSYSKPKEKLSDEVLQQMLIEFQKDYGSLGF